MENKTAVEYFVFEAFSGKSKNKSLISCFFCLIYLIGVLENSSIITVIIMEPQLHYPMYLFICNLAIVDMMYTNTIVPKLLHLLISSDNIISFRECYTQLYFFLTVAFAEEILLFIMAYDRYVAICKPLHYHRIISKRNCTLINVGIWMTACLNSLLYLFSVLHMTSCHSHIIHQIFCDAKSLTKVTCTGAGLLDVLESFEVLLFGLFPFLCSLISYIKIFSIILRIKSIDGKRKAFSTCSSHLSVITLYQGSIILVYLLPTYSDIMEVVFTIFYTTITPMLNPIIYSLQNSEIKLGLRKLMRKQLQ